MRSDSTLTRSEIDMLAPSRVSILTTKFRSLLMSLFGLMMLSACSTTPLIVDKERALLEPGHGIALVSIGYNKHPTWTKPPSGEILIKPTHGISLDSWGVFAGFSGAADSKADRPDLRDEHSQVRIVAVRKLPVGHHQVFQRHFKWFLGGATLTIYNDKPIDFEIKEGEITYLGSQMLTFHTGRGPLFGEERVLGGEVAVVDRQNDDLEILRSLRPELASTKVTN